MNDSLIYLEEMSGDGTEDFLGMESLYLLYIGIEKSKMGFYKFYRYTIGIYYYISLFVFSLI